MIDVAIGSYGFLLPYRCFSTPTEFATLIAATYSLENPRNRAIYEYISALPSGLFYKDADGSISYGGSGR